MKRIIIINMINILLFILLAIAYLILDAPPAFLLIFLLWVAYVGFINYQMFVKDNDKLSNLKLADSHNLFNKEIIILTKTVQSVEFYRNIFEKYDIGSSMRDTYDLLSKSAYDNVDKATKWIQHYDYISRPPMTYIKALVDNSKLITTKLNELDELVLKVDDSTDSIDMSFVDDMLNSLREVLNNEEQ